MDLKQALGFFAFFSFAYISAGNSDRRPLGEFIKHFEPLNYDTSYVHSTHSRAVSKDSDYEMQFDAFGKQHRLRLRQDKRIFTPDAVIQTGNGEPIDIDRSSFLTGEVVGEPGSKVHGVMEDGAFRGKIIGSKESYYVEPAKRYIKDPEFHSVIYNDKDVHYEANYADTSKRLPNLPDHQRRDLKTKSRKRRATENEKQKNACTLALYADQRFTKLFGGQAEAAKKVIEHVQAVKVIYGSDFNQTKLDLYAPYGITFRVKTITVYDDSDVPEKYKPNNLGIDPMLDLLSDDNHDDVCEAFLFTDRDFDGGILGLAWIGNPSSVGGVCSRNYDTGGGKKKSYNTGIVTLKLYGRFTPPKVSEVTFAHELGHGFGSQHDPDGKCSPGGVDGNYIMYSKATSGDRPNNNIFSECSLTSIRDNVNAKRQSSFNCFTDASAPICGNRVIEADEQCDCGDAKSCASEGNCCNPPGHARQCKVKTSGDCSLSQGPCCNKTCKYTPNKPCFNGTECLEVARCPLSSFTCPKPDVINKDKLCNKKTGVCGPKGDCSKSICSKYSLEECQCSAEAELCDMCCKEPGDGKSCISVKNLKQFPSSLTNLKKVAGAPCANMHGYCDVFSVCRRVDMSGPLKRLKEKFFTVKGLKSTASKYWWAILLGIIGGIVFIVLLVLLCSRYTPSSNPIREQRKPAKPLPRRKKKNQDRIQDARQEARHSPAMEMEQDV